MRWGASKYKMREVKYCGNPMKVFYNARNKRYALSDVFGFGKHHDKAVQFIVDTDPSYVKWLMSVKPSDQFFMSFNEEAYTYIFKKIFNNNLGRVHPFYTTDFHANRAMDMEDKLQDAINEMKNILKENNQ